MVIPEDFDKFKQEAKAKKKENKKFFSKLKTLKNGELDTLFNEAHEEVFACTDCLKCANCCKTTGPLFTQKDIERISTHLKMKPGQFVSSYLHIDEDQDYVLNTLPCPFLADDNYCGIYEVRPKACREYPHTDDNKMHRHLGITVKNVEICPAVYTIVEELKKKI
ncbi:MAG: YkgJ family cysteine cluster protein [Chitinophagales bacterium]|nr:YkgJ family cysteine cluster protein [Chitinophagales bacterium]